MKRITTSVTLASGGLAAAASVAIGVAAANPDATQVSVPNPFGITYPGDPTFTYQTGNAYQDIAYGHQTINIDSSDFAQAIDKFFTSSGVTVGGEPFSASNQIGPTDLQATIIDKTMSYGYQEQQILLPNIPGTNIDSGVIDLHNFGAGYGYLYIDLVGPGVTHLNSPDVQHAVGVLLVTPTGTYDVSSWENGGDYGDMAYMESQLFDLTSPANTVDNPFGITLVGDPVVNYQTGDVLGSTAYGNWTFDFDSKDIAPFAQQFFDNNVTVDGQPLGADYTFTDDANFIDKLTYNGVFNGISEQQLLLPTIEGTNIEHGVIDIHNYGNGFGYDYIDLVGTNGHDAVGAWLVTPWDTYDVSPWASIESQMFDASAFDPSVFFPADGLEPPFNFWF